MTVGAAGAGAGGDSARVRDFLAAHGFGHDRLIEADRPTRTAAEAAEYLQCDQGQIVKSLVVVAGGQPALLLVAGDRRGDLAAAGSELGREPVKLATPEVVRQATGYEVGAVSPFDLSPGLDVVIDDSLTRFETVYPAGGTPSSMVRMRLDELVSLARGRVARISH